MSQAPSSSRPGASPQPLRLNGPNSITKVLDTHAGRILCIADIRGRLSILNSLAKEHNAKAIIHTGDFGFYGALFSGISYMSCSGLMTKQRPQVLKG